MNQHHGETPETASAGSSVDLTHPRGGLSVTAQQHPLRLTDHLGKGHTLLPGKAFAVLPVRVAGSKPGTNETSAFRPAPPASVLWAAIENLADKEVSITLDPSGLRRDSALWGRPSILVLGAGDAAWRLLSETAVLTVPPESRLLVVAVGHGLAVDPATVFSSLLSSAASLRAKARQEKEDHAE